MLINITVTSIVEKSWGGERESSKQGTQAAQSTPIYQAK